LPDLDSRGRAFAKERTLSTDINPAIDPATGTNADPHDLNEDIDLAGDLKDTDSDEGDSDSGMGGGMRSQWSASDMEDEETSPLSASDLDAGLSGTTDVSGLSEKSDSKRRGMDEESEEDDVDLNTIDDILALPEEQFPRFTLAKNKARFLRMVSWYKNKKEWLEVAPLSGVSKLFKQQTKELVGIRASKLDYEMELETGTLTPSQRSYRRDELKMCKVHEKMAVNLIARMQVKIKSGRR
jgi:hypothetical protein